MEKFKKNSVAPLPYDPEQKEEEGNSEQQTHHDVSRLSWTETNGQPPGGGGEEGGGGRGSAVDGELGGQITSPISRPSRPSPLNGTSTLSESSPGAMSPSRQNGPSALGKTSMGSKTEIKSNGGVTGTPVNGGIPGAPNLFQKTVIPPIPSSDPVQRKISRPGSGNSAARQSAWERAQARFQEQERAMVEHKKTQPIQEFVSQDAEELQLLDVGCCNKKAFSRVFRSKKFKNPKLERLYQRYFFKLNQTNLSWLMGLVAALCVILVIFHYVGGSSSIVKGVVLGIVIFTLIVLEIISNQGSFNHIQLYIVSYIVFGLLVIIVIVVTIDTSPQTASQGVWCTLFCIYMVYTLLPVRMRLSALAGITLASTHVACSAALNHSEPFLWKQVGVAFMWIYVDILFFVSG